MVKVRARSEQVADVEPKETGWFPDPFATRPRSLGPDVLTVHCVCGARREGRRPKPPSVCHLYALVLADDDCEVDPVPLIGDFGRADSMVESLECRCWPGSR